MVTAKNLEPLVGSPYDYNKALLKTPYITGSVNGQTVNVATDLDMALNNGGYQRAASPAFSGKLAEALAKQNSAIGVTYNYVSGGQTYGHTVALKRVQTLVNQAGKISYKVWVMDPNKGVVRFMPNRVVSPVMFGVFKL
jgi:hypothetical protein